MLPSRRKETPAARLTDARYGTHLQLPRSVDMVSQRTLREGFCVADLVVPEVLGRPRTAGERDCGTGVVAWEGPVAGRVTVALYLAESGFGCGSGLPGSPWRAAWQVLLTRQ